MKSIFKKIALVLALAMVVTMIPAQTAKAAEKNEFGLWNRFFYAGETTGTWASSGYVGAKVAADQTATFESADPKVATVDEKGLVTAVAAGQTTVTVTILDAEGAVVEKLESTITVRKSATQVVLANTEDIADVTLGDTITLKADMYVGDDKVEAGVVTDVVRFTSDDASIVKVDAKTGVLEAVGVGTTKINVFAGAWDGATKNDEGKVTAVRKTTEVQSYTVTVKEFTDQCKLEAANTELQADGVSGTIVTFTLYESKGVLNKTAKDVQIKLDATRGTFAEQKVTLVDGQASVLYTSEISTVEEIAKLTAIVVAAGKDDQDLINKNCELEIKLTPEVKNAPTEDGTGATVTQAIVETADRITLYFNKAVSAAKFMNDGGTAVANFDITIDDRVLQADTVVGSGHEAKTLTAGDFVNVVAGPTEKSLTFILKNNADRMFTDNSKFILNFTDRRYAGAPVTTTGISNVVTDAVKPALLKVESVDLRTLKLTFSEPINMAGTGTRGDYALDLTKVRIDGALLGIDGTTGYTENVWGCSTTAYATLTWTQPTDSSVKSVENTTRNVVYVTLGQYNTYKNVYFTAGWHSIQLNSVGDFASLTDVNNYINTQTFDFYVQGNDLTPDFAVTVQSPEQILVTFNTVVEPYGGTGIAGANAAATVLKLQVYNEGTSSYVDVTAFAGFTGGQDYKVTKIDDKNYLIEVVKDWTVALNTGSSKKNHFNYKFQVAMANDSVYNVCNGKPNKDTTPKALNEIINTIDVTAPTVTNAVYDIDNVKLTIDFSEPIQSTTALMTQVETPSQQQSVNGGVPYITIEIVETPGLAKTITGTIASVSKDDKQIVVTPAEPLEAGKGYDVVIRNVTDDIGNAANTKHPITIKGTTTTPDTFKVLAVQASFNATAGFCASTAAAGINDGNADAIYVEFSSDFKKFGGIETVLTTTNWTINGAALPSGSSIVANLVGAKVADGHKPGITIILPDGTIQNESNTVVTIATTVLNKDGVAFSGPSRFVTQFNPCADQPGHTH